VAARNSIDLDRDPQAIVAMREFDAPRALVWEAWTDPKHLAQWWGPNGFSTTTSAFDMRPGGVWRFVMHGPDGRDYENRITFDEIVQPERIRYHHGGGGDVEPVQFRTTVTFEDLGSNRTRLTLHAVFPSAAERDRVIKEYGADKGAMQTLSRLADYVAHAFGLSRKFHSKEDNMPTVQKITPCLWFDTEAEAAANHYVSIFKNSKIAKIGRYGKEGKEVHGKEAGSVMAVEFEIEGQKFVALNGGPQFKFDEAISFQISCETQAEIDHFWSKLTEGGKEVQCGWLKDKFGLSWQVVPKMLTELMGDPDPDKAGRVMKAMLQMKKFDIAALQKAAA